LTVAGEHLVVPLDVEHRLGGDLLGGRARDLGGVQRGWPARLVELIGDVEYRSRTGEGYLRHPSWKGLRHDKTVAEL